MKTTVRHFLLALSLFLMTSVGASAQCAMHNTAFKTGEYLSYNLYYNWKFVWVKAGTASMSTVQSQYKGKSAWRGSLVTRGNKKVDEMFVLRDTLLSYCSNDLMPLYFRKGAREGKRYTVDEVFYSYPDGQSCHARMHRQHNDGTHTWNNKNFDHCVFDMLNIFLRARSFNPSGWQKGHVFNFPLADGKETSLAQLIYRGKTTVKADNGKKYRCLQLSYMEKEKGKWKEIVRFYVTDDANHVPVRLDLFLRFGSAKAFLVGMQGVRNPITSQVK